MSSKEDNTSFFNLLGNLEAREKALKKLAGKIKKGSILDLATGSGYLAGAILDKNPQASVTCIDTDPAQLKATRARHSAINCVCADARNLPFKKSSFDCTATWSALVHIEGWRDVISESFRVSKSVITAEPHGALSVRAFRDFGCTHSYPKIEELQSEFEKYASAGVEQMEFISLVFSPREPALGAPEKSCLCLVCLSCLQ